MLAPVTHFLPLTKIRRERVLPVPGKVIVRTGQKVNATDVVAEARLNSSHVLLDIVGMLDISKDQVDQVMRVAPNQVVGEGDILAGPVGVFQRTVRAPQAGRIIYCNRGQILFEKEATPFQLLAGMDGVVKSVIADRGAVIETTGSLVQGVWGNGCMDEGSLLVATPGPRDELQAEMVERSMTKMVLLAGHVTRLETLKAMEQVQVHGLIVASISSNLVAVASQFNYPILVLDGFGKIPMNSTAYKILFSSEKRVVSVNASAWDRYTDTRPEVIIPLPVLAEVAAPPPSAVFSPGQSVRIVKSPLAGVVGKLIALKTEQTPLSNGLRVPSAVVNLENGDQTVVPLMNLDVIA